MARSIKWKIFWGLFGLLALFAGLVVWLFSQMPKTGPSRVEVTPEIVGVYAGGAYAWIIKTPHGAALVDAGMDKQGKAIVAELERQRLSPGDVHTVFITHGHHDHVAALSLFPKAKIWVGPGDAGLMRGERRSKAPLPALFSRLISPAPVPARLEDLSGVDKVDADGAEVRVIPVPGHTPGSMMFLFHDVLFTGDSLFGDPRGLVLPPAYICDNPADNRASIERLANISFQSIADGHAGFTDHAHEKLLTLLHAPR